MSMKQSVQSILPIVIRFVSLAPLGLCFYYAVESIADFAALLPLPGLAQNAAGGVVLGELVRAVAFGLLGTWMWSRSERIAAALMEGNAREELGNGRRVSSSEASGETS